MLEKPKNPLRHQLEKSKQNIYALAFVMGALPFLLVVLLDVAQYATIILLVCGGLGVLLRIAIHRQNRF